MPQFFPMTNAGGREPRRPEFYCPICPTARTAWKQTPPRPAADLTHGPPRGAARLFGSHLSAAAADRHARGHGLGASRAARKPERATTDHQSLDRLQEAVGGGGPRRSPAPSLWSGALIADTTNSVREIVRRRMTNNPPEVAPTTPAAPQWIPQTPWCSNLDDCRGDAEVGEPDQARITSRTEADRSADCQHHVQEDQPAERDGAQERQDARQG